MSQDSHTVLAQFTFKDSESKQKFVDFCNGEKGLNVTRSWPGCQSVEFYESEDDSNKIFIWQKWNDRESHESLVKMRREEGSFDMLGEWVESPPDITSLRPLNFSSNLEQIQQIVDDMCNVDYKVGFKHLSDRFVFIRPSGNPLDKNGWESMMTNEDVNVESSHLISINKLQIEDNMAYVCYTSHGRFTYKGTQNDDVAVFTNILQKVNGKWMVVMGQRSTGRKPEDSLPNF